MSTCTARCSTSKDESLDADSYTIARLRSDSEPKQGKRWLALLRILDLAPDRLNATRWMISTRQSDPSTAAGRDASQGAAITPANTACNQRPLGSYLKPQQSAPQICPANVSGRMVEGMPAGGSKRWRRLPLLFIGHSAVSLGGALWQDPAWMCHVWSTAGALPRSIPDADRRLSANSPCTALLARIS
jgi:hypothetical protein